MFACASAVGAEEAGMTAGLNPVIEPLGDGFFKYIIYAYGMTDMTNGDISIHYDKSEYSVASVEETGNYDMVFSGDNGECVKISFIYSEASPAETEKLIEVTFSGDVNGNLPQTEITNIAGTFIRAVAKPVIRCESDSKIEEPVSGGDNEKEEKVMRGDVDGSGKITAADARLALRISALLEIPSERQKKAADTDGDGRVSASDARAILRFTSGLENFPKLP